MLLDVGASPVQKYTVRLSVAIYRIWNSGNVQDITMYIYPKGKESCLELMGLIFPPSTLIHAEFHSHS